MKKGYKKSHELFLEGENYIFEGIIKLTPTVVYYPTAILILSYPQEGKN